jgi:dTDP-4-dehydrorhamnose 3,5-epimerase
VRVIQTALAGVLIVEPRVFEDERGWFLETYRQERYEAAGMDAVFVQDNLSSSVRGTLRGLHYQFPNGQTKLVYVLEGEVLDVAVDIRRGSPSFGQWAGVRLSGKDKRQLYIPEGFAHGFHVVSETCSNVYAPECERGILWSDPDLGIAWAGESPRLSEKDRAYPLLRDIPPEHLPPYDGL